MALVKTGLAVPVKILKRSSFTRFSLGRRVAAKISNVKNQKLDPKSGSGEPGPTSSKAPASEGGRYKGISGDGETLRINRQSRFLTTAHTCSAKLFRRRRPDRAETRQRLGAP